MATVSTWTGVSVDVQSALAASIPATGITKANPGVLSHAGADPSDGEYVLIAAQGMSDVDSRVFRVDNQASGTFELEGEDTTLYDTFSSGGFQVITFGTSATIFTGLTASGGDFNFIDVTTIHDVTDKQIPGNASAAVYTFDALWDAADAGAIALKALSDSQSLAAFRFTFRNGQKVVFNGYVGANLLPLGSAGDKVVTNIVVTMFGRPTVYAT